MDWKPNPPIAAVLGLITTPLGMLYVQRPALAALYFGLSVLAGTAAFFSMWAFGSELVTALLTASGWLIAIACAVHAFRIAKHGPAVEKRAWYSRWYALGGIVVAILFVVFLARSFLYEPFRVPSQSMYPNVPAGSMIFIKKSGFGHYGTFGFTLSRGPVTEQIRRGDIVVHQLVADPSVNYVSRIVALPGDHITYSKREMTINEQAVPTSLGRSKGEYQHATERLDDRDIEVAFMPERFSRDFDEVVPQDHYVVFGDNRDNARDSRYIGFVPRENIVGRAVTILRPRD